MGEMMHFMRCNDWHHSLAIARGPHTSVHHVSFEMRGLDEYMRGTGRVMRAGIKKVWGPGRHLAGNNTFSYFLDPSGNTMEYTTELERLETDQWHPTLYDIADPMTQDQWGTVGPDERDHRPGELQRPRQGRLRRAAGLMPWPIARRQGRRGHRRRPRPGRRRGARAGRRGARSSWPPTCSTSSGRPAEPSRGQRQRGRAPPRRHRRRRLGRAGGVARAPSTGASTRWSTTPASPAASGCRTSTSTPGSGPSTINVTGPMLGIQALVPLMPARLVDRQHLLGRGDVRPRRRGVHRQQVGAARPDPDGVARARARGASGSTR